MLAVNIRPFLGPQHREVRTSSLALRTALPIPMFPRKTMAKRPWLGLSSMEDPNLKYHLENFCLSLSGRENRATQPIPVTRKTTTSGLQGPPLVLFPYIKGLIYKATVLLCWHCHYKVPKTKWLKQQKCIPPALLEDRSPSPRCQWS